MKRLCDNELPKGLRIHFNNGPCVSNLSPQTIRVQFYNGDNCVYRVTLGPDSWGRCKRRYRADWRIEIEDEAATWSHTHRFDLKGRRVLVRLDSRMLGDTLAWMPQIARFADAHPETEVLCSEYWPDFGFQSAYRNIRFISPDDRPDGVYATFFVGLYFGDEQDRYHPADPRLLPLARVAADIMGIEYVETRPKLAFAPSERPVETPYVCIATQSTAGAKLWQRPGGWQRVVDYLHTMGYQVLLIQREDGFVQGAIDATGDRPIVDRMNALYHCEFFIGLGSGLSWLAWALGKPTVMISGFSKPYTEFNLDCYRVINSSVCNGCWNELAFTFDKSDWNWCPRHQNTARQFECTREISVAQVCARIDEVRDRPEIRTPCVGTVQSHPEIRSVADAR